MLRLIVGLLIAVPVYGLGFALYACQDNVGCTAMALPGTVVLAMHGRQTRRDRV